MRHRIKNGSPRLEGLRLPFFVPELFIEGRTPVLSLLLCAGV